MKLIMEAYRKLKDDTPQSAAPEAKPKKNPKKGLRGIPYRDKPSDYDDPTANLDEDNYEDSGEPWNPKSSSYPFQHPQKGLLLRTRNRTSLDAWADNRRKENPDGQLTKAVRVAPNGKPGKAITRMAALMREDDITLEEMIEAAISEEMAALASEGN